MSAMFSNVFVIVVLQVAVILFSFFLPELLFRITKKQLAWHVLLASFFMIFSVIFFTLLYSSSMTCPNQAAVSQAATEEVPPEYTLRIGTLPLQQGFPMDVQLTVFNNGPANDFTCSLDFLDKESGKPLGDADFELVSEKDVLHLDAGGKGLCSWSVLFHKTGEVLADAFVQGKGLAPSNHEQIAMTVAEAQKHVAQSKPQPAASTPEKQVEKHNDATVWIYYTRDDATDSKLVDKLKARGYTHATAKGKWKTRSESQFLFHRTPDGMGVSMLRNALKLNDVEVYYFDEQRVGKKIKSTFKGHPELDFLVIAR